MDLALKIQFNLFLLAVSENKLVASRATYICVMAESNCSYSELPDGDSESLRESLYAKQLLLQKVYSELDEEREASSTAANEAMSMILRLQGEKAQLKMEASQYKREAEEKMCLAEESLAIFEDLLYQKEMEIATLEYQVQAYRYKLSDLGCSDIDIPEYKFPDSLPQQRNDSFVSEIGVMRSSVRRHDSLPSIAIKDCFPKKSSVERDRSSFLMPDSAEQDMNFLLDIDRKPGTSAGGDLSTYWGRIRKLDEQMKEITDGKINRRHNITSSRNRIRSCSVPPPLLDDCSLSCSPTLNLVDKKSVVTAASSLNFHDKFEVLQNTDSRKTRGLKDTEQKSLNSDGDKRHRKPVEENIESHVKNKVPPCPKIKEKPCKLREKTNNASEFQAELERLSQRLWRLENKENNTSHEINVEGEASAMMLKDILSQLNTLQSEMRKFKAKKSYQVHLNEQHLSFLTEAIVDFWL